MIAVVVIIAIVAGRGSGRGNGSGDTNDDDRDRPRPPLAVIPFENPRAHQEAWAAYLKRPRELREHGIDFVLIPGGRFRPGSSERQLRAFRDAGFRDRYPFAPESRQPEVELKPYYVAISEITRGQFGAFVRATNHLTDAERNGNGFGLRNGRWTRGDYSWWSMGGHDLTNDHAATNLSHNDAVAYCRWMTEKSGGRIVYRLPTEHEWEFAARAGSTTAWFFGDDYTKLELYAWHGPNAGSRVHPVRRLRPSPFGLYDIYGNESEWCADRYLHRAGDFMRLTPDDTSLESNIRCPQRGGNFLNIATEARSAVRRMSRPSDPSRGSFRIVREIAD